MGTLKNAIFSNDGEYFAFVSEHGSLKIWETSTNSIKQEYVLKSPTNLEPTALLWGPSKDDRNTQDNPTGIGHQYLVIGTNDGEVYLYNFDEGKMCFQFTSSHEESVNDLAWHPESKCVFSCSSDQSIAIWDIATGLLRLKWETYGGPLYSMCVIDRNNLLTAGDSISWWDINRQTRIKTFHGHGHRSIVHTLLSVSSTDYLPSNSYFLSTANGESTITAWHLNKSTSENVVASFDLGDELQNVDVTRTFSKDKPMFLSAVNRKGVLLLFKHVLNGRTSNNLVPQMALHVVSKPTGEYSAPSPIPVIASKFSSCSETVIIAYGSLENPIFERVKIIDCPKTLTLARDKSAFWKNSSESVLSQVNLYSKLGEYISANGKLPSLNTQYSSPKRRKLKDPCIDAEERRKERNKRYQELIISPVIDNKITSNSPSKKKKQRKIDKEIATPIHASTDIDLSDSHSVVNSLLQCLQTEDRASLCMVLQCKDDDSITNSVASIPSSCLRFILIELHKILSRQEQRYRHSPRKWLKQILKVHLSYLTNSKDHIDILDLFKDFIDRKRVAETLMKMSSLRGLLNIHRIQHTSNDSSDSETEELMES